MHRLITSVQETKLTQMLDDQNVSTNNMIVHFDEVEPKPYSYGTKRIAQNFNDWAEHYLSKPNGLF